MASTNESNQAVKLTKTVIDQAPLPASGQAFLRDTELKGFALRMTPGGAKAFVVEKRIEGRVRRKTLGRHGELTVMQARKLALKWLGQVASGINPIAERERARVAQTTLAEAFKNSVRHGRRSSLRRSTSTTGSCARALRTG